MPKKPCGGMVIEAGPAPGYKRWFFGFYKVVGAVWVVWLWRRASIGIRKAMLTRLEGLKDFLGICRSVYPLNVDWVMLQAQLSIYRAEERDVAVNANPRNLVFSAEASCCGEWDGDQKDQRCERGGMEEDPTGLLH